MLQWLQALLSAQCHLYVITHCVRFMSKINDHDDNAFDLYKLAFALGCPLPRSCFKDACTSERVSCHFKDVRKEVRWEMTENASTACPQSCVELSISRRISDIVTAADCQH